MSRREPSRKPPKAKNKDRSEVEHLRGENRALKKENGQLKRRLKSLEKRQHYFEECSTDPEDFETFEMETAKLPKCTDCGKGELEEYDVVGRYWQECNLCNYRTPTVKK